MLTIYGAPRSRAFRVIWLANEIGIPYPLAPVFFGAPDAECKQPWYLQLNPNGKVPTIEDDGFVLWESAAINLYLAERHKSPMYPSSLQARGWLLQWTLFAANELEPAIDRSVAPYYFASRRKESARCGASGGHASRLCTEAIRCRP